MFLYYIVRTLKTYIRKYMGTIKQINLHIKGLLSNSIFFNYPNLSVYFIIMSTLIFTCGYNLDLYFPSLLK